MNGVTSIVRYRSSLFSRALEAMIAGTLQPKPSIIGIKARPDRPILFIISFII